MSEVEQRSELAADARQLILVKGWRLMRVRARNRSKTLFLQRPGEGETWREIELKQQSHVAKASWDVGNVFILEFVVGERRRQSLADC